MSEVGLNPLANVLRFGFTPQGQASGASSTDYLHVRPYMIVGLPPRPIRFGFMPIAGTTGRSASLAITEANDTLAATCNTLGLPAISAVLAVTEQDDRIFAAVHRNSYIPGPPGRGYGRYVATVVPKPWINGGDDCPDW